MKTKSMQVVRWAAALLLCSIGGSQAAITANAPMSDFPSFIPFSYEDGEWPEGVAVDKVGNVYVSVRANILQPGIPLPGKSDQIWKFTPNGERSILVDLGANGGGGIGLAVDSMGNVYLAHSVAPKGVLQVHPDGNMVLIAGTEQIGFPNALAFDQEGNLYITESHSFENPICTLPDGPQYGPAGIWVVPKGGTAKLWLRDELLNGNCPVTGLTPFGANGIGYYHGDLYVMNTDKGMVVRVPVLPNGQPGMPEAWAYLQEVYPVPLPYGVFGDGLAIDVAGNVYVAMVIHGAIVRINAVDRSQQTIAAGAPNLDGAPLAPLDYPTSLAFGTSKGGRTSLFVAVAGMFRAYVPPPPGMVWPGPGLVKIESDIPGLPLP